MNHVCNALHLKVNDVQCYDVNQFGINKYSNMYI